MLIDLSSLSVFSQQSTQDPLSSHPNHTGRHSCLSSTLSLTRSSMSTLSLCSMILTNTESRMHNSGFLDNESISIEFADVLTGVCVGDFRWLVGIEPDFTFAAAENFRGEGFLGAKVRHGCWWWLRSSVGGMMTRKSSFGEGVVVGWCVWFYWGDDSQLGGRQSHIQTLPKLFCLVRIEIIVSHSKVEATDF